MTRSTSAPRSVTEFHSEDTQVPERPTAKIKIGTRTYQARAPKYQVWWDVAKLLEANELAGEATRRLSDEEDTLSAAEKRELLEQINIMPAFGGMEDAIIYGHIDEMGVRRGGFLRRCLKTEDWEQLIAEVADDDADLDLPDLYHAARTLQSKFQAWFEARSETMGLPTPGKDTRSKTPRSKK